ncbi:MAG TPA: methionyl-tRNA formyltransferase [Bryobacteraceae bacterium]|nr:methionyl-tRNA formyltransferase [Bryobacteraceae bacterium]
MRLVFLGTPQFAVPTLERVVEAGHEIAGVFTQPDRPKGRGHKESVSPIKQAALRLKLPVHQPERVRRPEVVAQLAALRADAMVVVGYGQIIPQSIIDLPKLGIINVHGSLLPAYRGAAPIQWAIARGETRTGVTTMRIDAGLDTGDILLQWETGIAAEETAVELGYRLAAAGADLLVETLAGLQSGAIMPEKQDNAKATYAPILKKEDGHIDWGLPALEISNRIRGFQPWPGCYTEFRGQRLHIWKATPAPGNASIAGTVFVRGHQVYVACGEGTALELLEIQLEGRKRITADAFRNGYPIAENERLGEQAK